MFLPLYYRNNYSQLVFPWFGESCLKSEVSLTHHQGRRQRPSTLMVKQEWEDEHGLAWPLVSVNSNYLWRCKKSYTFSISQAHIQICMQIPAFLGENNIYQSEGVLKKVVLVQLHTYSHKMSCSFK